MSCSKSLPSSSDAASDTSSGHFALCWEKSRALRWRRRDLLSHKRRAPDHPPPPFSQSTMRTLAKKPANLQLLRPSPPPHTVIGQSELKVDKHLFIMGSSLYFFFFFFLKWEFARMETIIIDVTSVYHANSMSTAARVTTPNHSCCLHVRTLKQLQSNSFLCQCNDLFFFQWSLLKHKRFSFY